MEIHGVPTTCTARQFSDFPHVAAGATQERYEQVYGDNLRNQIRTQLNTAKSHRIVNVFAFLIHQQRFAGAILEEFGFTCVANYNNYKYPDTSRVLMLYSRDMNTWVAEAAPARATFTAPAAPARPQPAFTAAPQIVLNPTTYRGDTEFSIAPSTQSLRRTTHALRAVPHNAERTIFRTPRGGFVADPYPLNRWVDWERTESREIPAALSNTRITVQLANGAVAPGVGADFTWHTQGGTSIVRVMRTGPYPA